MRARSCTTSPTRSTAFGASPPPCGRAVALVVRRGRAAHTAICRPTVASAGPGSRAGSLERAAGVVLVAGASPGSAGHDRARRPAGTTSSLAAGLVDVEVKSFLLEVPPPLPARVRETVRRGFVEWRDRFGHLLDREDNEALAVLIDEHDPRGVLHRSDVFVLGVRTAFVGRKERLMSDHRGQVRVEQSHKRVRAYLGGELVFDTIRPSLVWEIPHYPAYYIPIEDVVAKLDATDTVTHSPSRGDAQHFTVRTVSRRSGRRARGGIPTRRSSRSAISCASTGRRWTRGSRRTKRSSSILASPYSRVDTLASSSPRACAHRRRGRGRLDATRAAVRDRAADAVLRAADRRAHRAAHADRQGDAVPVQGNRARTGRYGSATTSTPTCVWSYPTPLPESIKVAGLMSFYNEHVDIEVDGVLQERPHTPFS